MTGRDDFDRMLTGWFEADAQPTAPVDGLGRVLDATRRRRPRPAWLASPGSHWVGEAPTAGSSVGVASLWALGLRWSTAIILLLAVVALVGGAILVGVRLLQPSRLPTGQLGHLAHELNGDIYVDWDGENPVRISDGPTDCGGSGDPTWSPDGRHLAYLAWRSSDSDPCASASVVISDPAGHVVKSFPGLCSRACWSPDSTRVAAWDKLSQNVAIYGIDGVRQRSLALPPGHQLRWGDFYDTLWSPDGRSILIKLEPGTPSYIWELPFDGGTPRPVPADDPRSTLTVAYSQDGTRAAFIVYPAPAARTILDPLPPYGGQLVVAAADRTQRQVLVAAEPGQKLRTAPKWSPRSDRIAFIVVADDAPIALNHPNVLGYELRVVDVASGAVTSLASAPGTGSLDVLKFSPEGDRILFTKTDADVTSLWSARTDGSDAQLLVEGSGSADWQWLPADR